MYFHVALLLALNSAQAEPADGACGMFSQDVYGSGGAWSGCGLKRAGEKPLWQKTTALDEQKVLRLVFSSGRDSSFRYITLTMRADGKPFLVSGGLDAQYRKPRKRWLRQKTAISLAQWDKLIRLTAASGTFDHEIGTWDDNEIYMHCQNLSLERADQEGYRFSSVSIGCNRPEKLAPLVDKVVELANRKRLFSGWLPN